MSQLVEQYKQFVETNSDPRTKDWFLMSGPGPLLTILVTYWYFCKYAGPQYMKDKKPYDLKRVIQAYNVINILVSCYLVFMALDAGWARDYKFSCQPVDYSEKGLYIATATWNYFMVKIFELLDTIFFILRKKYNQASYLHIYHHMLMPCAAWIGVKFLAGGHGTLLGAINSFIHIIMYSYYLLASLGPQYQKYLWWKRHLTALQLIQFSIVFVHNFQVLFRECSYPKPINLLMAVQALYFSYLFGKFYIKSYLKPTKKPYQNGSTNENGKIIEKSI